MCEYEALCEDDDYWIDPMKIQIQVDYMDNHPDCGMTRTDVNVLYDKNGILKHNVFENGDFPMEGHPEVVKKFEGTTATPEFLQALAYEVYVKNVTFGLLHQWLTDMGMTISKNTLHNWLKKGKKYLDKLIVVLKAIALEKDSIVNCDETWCKVRKYDHYKKCYIWVLVNKAEKIAIFFYEDGSRGRDVLTHFLGDAELKSIMTDGYNAYVFIGDELKSAQFKDTDHQICMAHAMAKLAKAANPGGDKAALPFHDDLSLFYKLEDRYDEEGISPEERGRRRQSLETKEIMIRLRSRLDMELAKDETERSPYLTEALNYLNKFWDGIFAYQKDGNYPIDNNIAYPEVWTTILSGPSAL